METINIFNFSLPKRVSEIQKKEILDYFMSGLGLNEISLKYDFTKNTIIKQLKKIIGEEKFKKIKIKNTNKKKFDVKKIFDRIDDFKKDEISESDEIVENINDSDFSNINNSIEQVFFEVPPLSTEINTSEQKELTSEPLKDAKFPSVVYMLVDKKIELSPRLLKDYPDWSYMPKEDLERMTLEVFDDQRKAKKNCTKNQKLIKVPNPNIFLLASKSLKSKGISRIIFNNLLLAL